MNDACFCCAIIGAVADDDEAGDAPAVSKLNAVTYWPITRTIPPATIK